MIIKIDGAEYEMPLVETLTFKEAAIIKHLTGLKMGQYTEALTEADMDMVVALAVIAKRRKDGWVDENAMYNLPINKIEIYENDEPEVEADDPNLTAGVQANGSAPKKRKPKTLSTPDLSGVPS